MMRACRLLLFLLASLAAFAQNSPPISTTQATFPVYSANIQPVTQASAVVVGNPGPQTYFYWLVTKYTLGDSSPIGPFAVSGAPNTLSGSNYVAVTPVYLLGILNVALLRTSSPTPPTGACNCAVATAVTSGTINDQSNSLSAYTVSPASTGNLTLTLTNEVTGTGASHLILRQNGALVQDLSLTGGSGFAAGGDLTGTPSSQTVSGLLNKALPALTTGFLNYTGVAWAFSATPGFTAGGDLSGSSSTQTVSGLLGHALPGLATGFPNYNGAAWVFSTNIPTASALAAVPAICGAGNAPRGVLANGNATGCSPIGGGSSFTAGTDLSGTSTNQVVQGSSAAQMYVPPGTSAAPGVFISNAPNLGLYAATIGNTWTPSASSSSAGTATLTIGNTSGWPFSWRVGDYIVTSGIGGGYDCSLSAPCVLTAVNSGASTISYASAGVGNQTSGSVNAFTLGIAAQKFRFQSMQSTSANCANTGSIQLCAPDPITSHDVAANVDVTLIKKNSDSSVAPTAAAQLGDAIYGATTANNAPLYIGGQFNSNRPWNAFSVNTGSNFSSTLNMSGFVLGNDGRFWMTDNGLGAHDPWGQVLHPTQPGAAADSYSPGTVDQTVIFSATGIPKFYNLPNCATRVTYANVGAGGPTLGCGSDPTNASNILSGMMAAARLPNPANGVLTVDGLDRSGVGGVNASSSCPALKYINDNPTVFIYKVIFAFPYLSNAKDPWNDATCANGFSATNGALVYEFGKTNFIVGWGGTFHLPAGSIVNGSGRGTESQLSLANGCGSSTPTQCGGTLIAAYATGAPWTGSFAMTCPGCTVFPTSTSGIDYAGVGVSSFGTQLNGPLTVTMAGIAGSICVQNTGAQENSSLDGVTCDGAQLVGFDIEQSTAQNFKIGASLEVITGARTGLLSAGGPGTPAAFICYKWSVNGPNRDLDNATCNPRGTATTTSIAAAIAIVGPGGSRMPSGHVHHVHAENVKIHVLVDGASNIKIDNINTGSATQDGGTPTAMVYICGPASPPPCTTGLTSLKIKFDTATIISPSLMPNYVIDDTNTRTITAAQWTGEYDTNPPAFGVPQVASEGGTNSAFFQVAGPTALRTYTFPDASSTMVPVADAIANGNVTNTHLASPEATYSVMSNQSGLPACTVAVTAGSGAATWGYTTSITDANGNELGVSAACSTGAAQNATLSGAATNTVTCKATGSNKCDVYRTTSGGTPAQLSLLARGVAANGTVLDDGSVVTATVAAGAYLGSGANQTVYTVSIPGGTMASSECLDITVWYNHSTGSASTTFALDYAGTTITSAAQTASTRLAEIATLCNNPGSTSAQQAIGMIQNGTIDTSAPRQLAINSANAQSLNFKFNVASTDQVTPVGFVIRHKRAQ
jgi:hypothetical protein